MSTRSRRDAPGRASPEATGLVILAALLLATSCSRVASPPPSAGGRAFYGEATVDLSTLRERARPRAPRAQLPYQVTTGAFREILALRERPDPTSVETLRQVLEDNAGTSNIFRYAATQALFATGSEDELRWLDQHADRPDFDGRLAFMYAFHWEMDPAGRDRYLDRFVLRAAGAAPDLVLRATAPPAGQGARVSFELEFRNTQSGTISMVDPPVVADALVFRAIGGRVARTEFNASCGLRSGKMIQLATGESRSWTAVVEFGAPKPSAGGSERRLPAGTEVVGRCGAYLYTLGKPGTYDVRAFWTDRGGRALSAPVRVEVPAPR